MNASALKLDAVSLEKSSEDYYFIYETLKEIDEQQAVVAARDNKFYLDEVVHILDADGNGLTTEDLDVSVFSKDASVYWQFNNILQKNRISIQPLISNWDQAVLYFVNTGYCENALRADYTFAISAIQMNAHALRYFNEDELGLDYVYIAQEAIQANPAAMQYVSSSFQVNNPDVIEFALWKNYYAVEYTCEEYQCAHPEKIKEVILKNTNLFKFARPKFMAENTDFVTYILSRVPEHLRYVPFYLQYNHPEIIKTVVYYSPKPEDIYKHIHVYYKSSPLLLDQLLNYNFHIIQAVDIENRKQTWESFVKSHDLQGANIPLSALESYDHLIQYLKEKGIDYPRRFRKFSTLLHILNSDASNRPLNECDKQPVALLLYNHYDHNDAFDNMPVIDEMIAAGFNVVYRECNNYTDMYDVLNEQTLNGTKPVHSLLIAGHGTPESLTLGNDTESTAEGKVDMESRLTRDHFVQCLEESYIEEDGQIFIYGCSTGEGYGERDNFANAVAKSFPNRKVYSQPVTGNISEFSVNDDFSFHISFWAGYGYEGYDRTEPSKLIDAYVTKK